MVGVVVGHVLCGCPGQFDELAGADPDPGDVLDRVGCLDERTAHRFPRGQPGQARGVQAVGQVQDLVQRVHVAHVRRRIGQPINGDPAEHGRHGADVVVLDPRPSHTVGSVHPAGYAFLRGRGCGDHGLQRGPHQVPAAGPQRFLGLSQRHRPDRRAPAQPKRDLQQRRHDRAQAFDQRVQYRPLPGHTPEGPGQIRPDGRPQHLHQGRARVI